jgi:hypothetical protein
MESRRSNCLPRQPAGTVVVVHQEQAGALAFLQDQNSSLGITL